MGFLKKIGKGIGKIVGGGIERVTGVDLIDNNPNRRLPVPRIGLSQIQSPPPPRPVSRSSLFKAPTPRQIGGGSQPQSFTGPSFRDFDPFGDLVDFPAAEQFFTGNGQNGTATLNPELDDIIGPNRVVVPAQAKQIASCPSGFRAVTLSDGRKVCMRERFAKKFGFIKTRKKPPISASDWDKLKRAEQVKKKVKKVAQTADFVCRAKK